MTKSDTEGTETLIDRYAKALEANAELTAYIKCLEDNWIMPDDLDEARAEFAALKEKTDE